MAKTRRRAAARRATSPTQLRSGEADGHQLRAQPPLELLALAEARHVRKGVERVARGGLGAARILELAARASQTHPALHRRGVDGDHAGERVHGFGETAEL